MRTIWSKDGHGHTAIKPNLNMKRRVDKIDIELTCCFLL